MMPNKVVRLADVEEMLTKAQIISDGEYCGYCTEDVKLSMLPIVDYAPVIHAHWEKTGWKKSGGEVEYRCSNCKRCKVWRKKTQKLPYYCEKCGANMDEEVDK